MPPKKNQLAPETCSRCQKSISARARANVFGELIVCTPCWNKLDLVRIRARDHEALLREPATELQIARAKEDGIRFPANITKIQISILISLRESRFHFPTVWWENEDAIDLLPIVYGVVRFTRNADWAFWSECPIRFPIIYDISQSVASEISLASLIEKIDRPDCPDDVWNKASDRDDEGSGDPDEWWFVQPRDLHSHSIVFANILDRLDRFAGPKWRTVSSLKPRHWTSKVLFELLRIAPITGESM